MGLSHNGQIIDGVLYIPEGVTEIDDYEFFERTDFTKVVFPDTLKRIRGGAFCGCTTLAEMVLPDSLRNIEDIAFRNCGLREVTLPPGMKCVAKGAFAGCAALEKLIVLGNRVQFKPDWGVVFENSPNLKHVQMSLKGWKRNYRKKKWTELYYIPALGGIPALDIFRLLLEDKTRRFLNKIVTPDPQLLSSLRPLVRADLNCERFDATHAGNIYTLSISLADARAVQMVLGFEIDVLFCQDKLELADIVPSMNLVSSDPALTLNGKGNYRINDAFELGQNQAITRKYTVAHRPWGPPILEHYPALLALYCFRVRPLFADSADGEHAGPWSPRYVCALGPGLGYKLYPDLEYNYSSGLRKYFDVAGACFLQMGIPLGPPLMFLHIEETEDQDRLAEIALHEHDAWNRETAVRKLELQPVLEEISQTDADANVRIAAVAKLTNRALLEKTAQQDPDPGVREIAAGVLQNL